MTQLALDGGAAGPTETTRRLPPVALVPLAALVWWVGGYLPWLVSGLQSGQGVEDRSLRLALPLTTSTLSLLVLGALVGGTLAGCLSLAGRSGRRRVDSAATLAGVAVAVVLSAGQAASSLRSALPGDFDADSRVLAGLFFGVGLAALVGWGVGSCAALGPPGAGLALAVLAGAFPHWLSSLVSAAAPGTASGEVGRWIGLAMLAAALAVVGGRPINRLFWWPVVVAAAWFTGPVLTAVGYLEPSLRAGRGLDAQRAVDAVAGAVDVFGHAASIDLRPVWPWVLAVAVGAVAAVLNDRRPDPAHMRRSPIKEVSGA